MNAKLGNAWKQSLFLLLGRIYLEPTFYDIYLYLMQSIDLHLSKI